MMKNFLNNACRLVFFALALPCVIVTLWWWSTAQNDAFFWPTPGEIVAEIIPTWFEGRFVADVLPSLVRLGAGLGLAIIIGVVLGLLIGMNRTLREFLGPVLEFFRAIPPPILIPIFMLIFGIGDGMKIAIIAVGCLWPVLLNTIEGVRGLDPAYLDSSRSYHVRRLTTVRRIVMPAASPAIFAGIRQALSVAIILMVISELFASTNGIGYALVRFQREFDIVEMWTTILLLGVLGIVLTAVFSVIERLVLRWYLIPRQREVAKL